jgi:hypothetical protein
MTSFRSNLDRFSTLALNGYCKPLLIAASLTILSAGRVWASPITTIDLRDGMTVEKLNQYHAAVLGDAGGETPARLIKLLISADKGFDAGWLRVPKQRKILRVNVVIYTFRGEVINAPIKVNLFELDSQSINYINLEVSLR